jgi:hypothetical protein
MRDTFRMDKADASLTKHLHLEHFLTYFTRTNLQKISRVIICFRGLPFRAAFCKARFAGLRPWFVPIRGGDDLQFGLVRRALCIFAPRSTPNKLFLTAAQPGRCCS